MGTDQSIQNQKVFVKLAAVLQLQAEYHKVLNEQGSSALDIVNAEHAAKRAAIENAIIILELPIRLTLDPQRKEAKNVD